MGVFPVFLQEFYSVGSYTIKSILFLCMVLEVAGDMGSVPGLRRSPGEGNGNSLQYSCLGNTWTEEPGWLQYMGLQELDMT